MQQEQLKLAREAVATLECEKCPRSLKWCIRCMRSRCENHLPFPLGTGEVVCRGRACCDGICAVCKFICSNCGYDLCFLHRSSTQGTLCKSCVKESEEARQIRLYMTGLQEEAGLTRQEEESEEEVEQRAG